MARSTSPSCRQCRRAGEKLFLKGERCFGPKCAFTRRSFAPGMHGVRLQRRSSDYGLQLREKQKAKAMYGLLEGQFRRYVDKASQQTNTGFALMKLLELRLDNIVFRSGWAQSRAQARQLVNHGHVSVNGQMLNIPSRWCRAGDKIELHLQTPITEESTESVPDWLTIKERTVMVTELSDRSQIPNNINEQLIIEYYSR